jgi:hypothetical protein
MGLVILNEETDARMGFHSDFTGACILPLRPGCFGGCGCGLFVRGRARCVCSVKSKSPNTSACLDALGSFSVGAIQRDRSAGSSFPDCSDEKARERGAAFFAVSNCLKFRKNSWVIGAKPLGRHFGGRVSGGCVSRGRAVRRTLMRHRIAILSYRDVVQVSRDLPLGLRAGLQQRCTLPTPSASLNQLADSYSFPEGWSFGETAKEAYHEAMAGT